MGIQINGNTNNINAGIGSLSIEDLNELHIVGVATATRFDGETNGLVNVKTYGAVGDGTTDDRAAIQSAINSAKTVFFPAGTYRVGAALTVWDSYSALIGHESLPTIKVVGTGYSGPAVSVQSAGDNINEFSRIENIKFLFDKNSGGPATYSSTPNETNCGVSINGSLAPTASATNRVLRFKMENCRVLGFSNAINLKETTNTLLRRVIIEHNTDESSTTLSSSNIYCGVNFDGTPGQVGGISPQASVELHQVIFNGSGAPINTTSMGFRVTGQDPRDIFFEGCETAHGNYGWFIDPSDDDYNIDIHINRPIVDAVDTTGIYVKDWNGYGALTINGGYIVKDANNSGAGIWVENSRGVNITGGIQVLGVSLNNVTQDDGIRIKNSKICSVSSSTIMNCRYGISLEDSSNCSVTGNIVGAEIGAFTGGTNPVLTDAIRVFGNSDANTITGNTIKGASASYKYSNGILINASTCEENMVSSNVIDDSTVTIRLNDAGVRTNIFDRGKIGISTTSGGKLLIGGGTGSAIEFNDSSTRLEIPATNTLAAYTSSNERMRITSTGLVGIGTTNPSALLHVEKDGTSQVLARFESNLGTSNDRFVSLTSPTIDSINEPFTFTTGNSFEFKCDAHIGLHIDHDGKVGIDTSIPRLRSDIGGVSATGIDALNNPILYAGLSQANSNGWSGVVLCAGSNGNTPTIAAAKNASGTALPLVFQTDATTRMMITADGSVRVGDNSSFTANTNADNLIVGNTNSGNNHGISIISHTNSEPRINFASSADDDAGMIKYSFSTNVLQLYASGGEKLQCNSAGARITSNLSFNNWLNISKNGTYAPATVGHTASNHEGIFWHSAIQYSIFRTSGSWSAPNYQQLQLNWPTGIYIDGGYNYGLSGARFNCHALPYADNNFDLGLSNRRWDDVFATNGTINTSDQTLKEEITSLTAAEMKAAKRLSALFKKFKWKSAVAEKGSAARTHTGIIAQDVKTAMEAESLDPIKYAFFCYDEWYENDKKEVITLDQLKDNIPDPLDSSKTLTPPSTEGYTKVGKYSIRYTEILAFIAAYNDQRFADLESRVAALEGS